MSERFSHGERYLNGIGEKKEDKIMFKVISLTNIVLQYMIIFTKITDRMNTSRKQR